MAKLANLQIFANFVDEICTFFQEWKMGNFGPQILCSLNIWSQISPQWFVSVTMMNRVKTNLAYREEMEEDDASTSQTDI